MDRKQFLRSGVLMTAGMMTLHEFSGFASALKGSESLMPALFAGHGSPMNAIEDNAFTRKWKELGKSLPRPKAILCVSAHWMTPGSTRVTAMDKPRTIHDFGGFPEELFRQQYPAPGAIAAAAETVELVQQPKILPDHDWGLDHGCWSVLLPMFPQADIPVFQLSLDLNKPPRWHYELALQLKALRSRGIMVVGSGNIVHNLGRMQWDGKPYDWALEFDDWSRDRIDAGDHQALIEYSKKGALAQLAIPTNEHYLPMLYILAMQTNTDRLTFFNEQTVMGSVSMRSFLLS